MTTVSRMEKLEEQRNMRKVGMLAGVTTVVLLAAFLLGVPLMVRLAVWWGDFNQSRRPIEKTDLIPPVPPKIFVNYEATSSATIKLAGSAEPEAVVAIGMNDKPLGNVVADADGAWVVENVTLQEGVNKFFAVAVDGAGNKSAESEVVSITYLSKLPEITVESPSDHQLVTGKTGTIELKGSTGGTVRLTVNDRVIILGSGGRFVTTYVLSEGENVLVFVATSSSGSQTRKEIVVEYRK